jgi:hypothetical protein
MAYGIIYKVVNQINKKVYHELIHVWEIQEYGWEKASENKGHNDSFYKKRSEILSKFPDIEIPLKEDLEGIESILDKLGY